MVKKIYTYALSRVIENEPVKCTGLLQYMLATFCVCERDKIVILLSRVIGENVSRISRD